MDDFVRRVMPLLQAIAPEGQNILKETDTPFRWLHRSQTLAKYHNQKKCLGFSLKFNDIVLSPLIRKMGPA
jgi:hypothetical protein